MLSFAPVQNISSEADSIRAENSNNLSSKKIFIENFLSHAAKFLSGGLNYKTFLSSAMELNALENVNSSLNTNIYSYLEISGGQSSIYI